MPVETYRDLVVWQKAMDLVETVYNATVIFPSSERFGLTSQMQRAAVSIPANIAEGNARRNRGDYLHHLSIARGSLAELDTQLLLAVRLRFMNQEQATQVGQQMEHIAKMLNALIASLQRPAP